jgi:MerR family transcriptional regulator, light-induced transcriptional regulator
MYSIKEAASRSGVSIPTLRAWERRYGVVQPVRTPSGYRLYDDGAIARLRHMRALVASGWRPREAAQRVSDTASTSEQGDDGRQPQVSDAAADTVDSTRLIGRFVEAALTYDSAATEAILDEIFARGSFEWAMENVAFPALEQVGLAWESGDLSVAGEHAASQAVMRRVALFYEAAARATGADIIIGLPPGARHDLGALAFAVAARRLGVGVLFLGADVPVDSWVTAVRDTAAGHAVIAIPTPADSGAAAEVMRALIDGTSATCLAGGAGARSLPAELGAIILPDTISEAARAVATLVAGAARST